MPDLLEVITFPAGHLQAFFIMYFFLILTEYETLSDMPSAY